ncbi:hypothetical protein C7405_11855 [Paraburkholderia caballeronis]|uniref:autotransporter domain-containing protein n=1 Tax=Paraburkholderia caballeronis TaxID=416943 RepID=UPI00106579BC|nr:autotransporter domain-containing protein [Paraburkholderia caballeronis]TDV26846.1 hypothetical protein C7405_11855 [Paraburkholderia caballeronis]
MDRAFGDALKPVNVQVRLSYALELLDANRVASVVSQDGTQFTAPGTSLRRGYLTAGAGVTMHPAKNLSVSLSDGGIVNTMQASAQQGSLHVGYQFRGAARLTGPVFSAVPASGDVASVIADGL